MKPLQITSYTLTTALGAGIRENWEKLNRGTTGLRPCKFFDIRDLPAWVGQIDQLEEVRLEQSLQQFDCRNNRLSQLCLQQDNFRERIETAIDRYGAARIGVFVGTSTSGIHHTEQAYMQRHQKSGELPQWYRYETTQNAYSVTEFVRLYLGLEGVSSAVSTACSSSAKVFASAYRAIESGLCDAAVVGGCDSLCLTTLYGFNSLQLVAEDVCRPSDIERSGISIGEAAGFALLERCGTRKPEKDAAGDASNVGLLGYGESSDAYHMSSPHPEGEGAYLAMQGALSAAGLQPDEIDYIHLHGTGTRANDLSESRAIDRLFGNQLPCSSTKGWTGHTLGAAGITSAIFSLFCIENNFMPCSLHTRTVDPEIRSHILLDSRTLDSAHLDQKNRGVQRVLANAFGFGGSNCSLIFGELP